MNWFESASAIVAGLLFGAGLTISGVIDPNAVLGFLDVTNVWDPSLALVLLGALAVAVPAFALVRKKSVPLFAKRYRLPGTRRIDLRVIAGAILFGTGWGLVGLSPSTALAAISTGARGPLFFVGAMLVGMVLYRFTLGMRGGRGVYGVYYSRAISRRFRNAEKDQTSPEGG